MSSLDENPADGESYSVGYCKPPLEHRFGKENKASKGRKPGSKNFRTIIVDEVFQQVPYTDAAGRSRSAPAIALIVRRQVKSALNGDPRAADYVTRQVQQYCPPPEAEGEDETLSAAELAVLSDHAALTRMIAEAQNG